MAKELVGFEISEKSVNLEGQELVGKISAIHVGKIGSLELSLKGKFEFIPLVNSGLDKLEEIIPGDQKAIFAIIKTGIANIKIKF